MEFINLKLQKVVNRPKSAYRDEHIDIVTCMSKKTDAGILTQYPILSIYDNYKIVHQEDGDYVTFVLKLAKPKDNAPGGRK